MPAPVVKSLAKKSGKKKGTVEDYWKKAKKAAGKKFDKKDKSYWAYTTAITKKMAGLDKGKKDED